MARDRAVFPSFVGGVVDGELNTRTIRTDVEFRHPFTLTGLEGLQPPGVYQVEAFERLLDTVSTIAYQRVSTSIELRGQSAGITRTATIDPDELAAALTRDSAWVESPAAPSDRVVLPRAPESPQASNIYGSLAGRLSLALPIGQGHISFDSRRLFWIAVILVCGLLALLALFPGLVERAP